jgi:hypothetical protein
MTRTRPDRRESTGFFSRLFAPRDAAAPRRPRRRRLAIEVLEGRQLLSLYGSEHLISLNPQNSDNIFSADASSSNGASVAVWLNNVADSDTNFEVWAQRFDKNGQIAGAPIPVGAIIQPQQVSAPRVAMDAQGRFVVAYNNLNPDGTQTVMMRYYSATGAPLTTSTPVTPAGESDFNPSVAASNGSFVISWTHLFSPTDGDIDAERFTVANNVPTGHGTFAVNDDTSIEDVSCVAMAPNGRFDIAYQRYNGSDWDIWASQYGSSGNLLRGNISIDSDSNSGISPSIAMDNADNAVVAYAEAQGTYVIYANRLSSSGVVGGQILVGQPSNTFPFAYMPSVALAPTGGMFVVAYYGMNEDTSEGIFVTEVGSDNSPLATFGEFTSDACVPGLSIDGHDRYMVTFQDSSPSGQEEIYSMRDVLGDEPTVSLNVQPTDNANSAVASSADGASVAVWVNADSPTDHNIWAQRLDTNGQPAGAVIPVDTTAADSYDPHVAMDSQGRFVVTYYDQNPDGTYTVMMRYFSASGAPLTASTAVTPAGETDYNPSVAASNGSFVIAWTNQSAASYTNIKAERFTVANNVPTGHGIFALTAGANDAGTPSVAMAPDGRFDIAYAKQSSGFDWDIWASQYDSSGDLLHGGIAVNTDSNPELAPSIAMDNAGNAVVAYQEYDGSNWVVLANRLNAGGTVVGLIPVADITGVNATRPSVALAPTDGLFVVAYQTTDSSSNTAVGITEVGSNDAPLATLTVAGASDPSVSIDGFDRYTVTFTQPNWWDGHDDIFSRRYFLS